ncbi:type-1A angiotensin II receptor [Alosa alosa]|uniref:type-1A angiotensin II receptor n=1 Tax=Alosa alosa TaxID=278164 RepID=UPI0020151855|nr:type-1A angiotensin II receptor [Alosa alosa]
MENSTKRENSNELTLDCNMTGTHDFISTFIPVVYSCNFVIGIVGNSMVVAVIHYYMKMKTVANIFVLNLAVSDLTFLITLPMWATVTAMGYHWPFGSFVCKATAALVLFNLYTSVFFLTALSIDRYLAIVRPVESRRYRTVRYARLTCILVWTVSLLLSLPTAFTRSTVHIRGNNITVCAIRGDESNRLLVPLSLMKGVLGFLVPLGVILTCYCLIGRALQGPKVSIQGSNRCHSDEVLHMLAAAVMAFFLCWGPHQVFNLLYLLVQLEVISDCRKLDVIDTAMPFTVCIAFFNTCVNPILYGFVGKNFRWSLLRLLRCAQAMPVSSQSHPSLSTKMSTLSYRGSNSLLLTAAKTSSLSRSEHCVEKK